MTEEVEVDGMIRLGQFLKYAGMVDSGGQAHQLIADGDVEVNGETETRRGRQLHAGDVVSVITEFEERHVRIVEADEGA